MKKLTINQSGAIPLLFLFTGIAVLLFLGLALYAPVRSLVLTTIFPRSFSQAATINTSLGAPTNGNVTNLDSTIRVTWDPSTDTNIAWQLFTVWEGDKLINTKVLGKTSKAADANGVQYGKTYTIRVQSMNSAGELSNPLTVTGQTDPQSPMRNAAFFESFNDTLPGDLDYNYFDVRTSLAGDENGLPIHQMIFNNERHFHTMVTAGDQKGGLMVRSRVPFDFTNRVGTLQFEVDLPPIQTSHGKWFELNLTKDIPGTDDDFGDANGGQFPNSIEFGFRNESRPLITTNINGVKTQYDSQTPLFTPLNVRVPVVIKVSRNSAQMYVNGQLAISASGFDLGFSKAFVTIAHRNYYTPRRATTSSGQNLPPIMVQQMVHWDMLQYDGPDGSFNPVVKTYLQPNCPGTVHYGGNFGEIPLCQANPMNGTPVNINIPDSLANARSARFLMNGDGSGTININGNEIPIPADVPGVAGYAGSLRSVEIPVSWLRQGNNQVSVRRSTDQARRMWQLEIEVIYNTPRVIGNPPMAYNIIAATSANIFTHKIPSDPNIFNLTTYLYNSGSAPTTNFQAQVTHGAEWLTITSPTSGTLTPITANGTLVPLNLRVDYANVPSGGGKTGIIKVTGGDVPLEIAIYAMRVNNRLTFAPASAFPSIITYNKAAVPDYYGDGSTPSPTAQPTNAPTAAPTQSPAPRTVSISNFNFSPQSLMVNVGDTVTWVNNDSTNHTVTSSNNAWTSRTLTPGQSFTHTFTQAGTFSYSCTIHPSMTGSVMVHGGTTPSGSPKPADINADNRVDIFDYHELINDFGKTGSNLRGDIDKDGRVTIHDYNLLLSYFGANN